MKRRLIPIIFFVIALAVITTLVVRASKPDIISTPSACVHTTISTTTTGHCVSDLQTMLNWSLFGIDGPNYKPVTGIYSSETTKLITQYQSSVNIPQTGTVTTTLWEKLCRDGSDATAKWNSAAHDAGCVS